MSITDNGNHPASYGERVTFQKDSPIEFEDLILTFIGDRFLESSQYSRMIRFLDFTIMAAGSRLTVSWRSGLGEICSTEFRLSGTCFSLELGISWQLGMLQDNELVLTRASVAA